MARVVEGINGLKELVGEHLGYSDWIDIDQGRVNTFADATGDHQWIHVDPERAAKESPFGGPIAHGYLTMSLGPMLFPQIMSVSGIKMGVNYGCGKVRFQNFDSEHSLPRSRTFQAERRSRWSSRSSARVRPSRRAYPRSSSVTTSSGCTVLVLRAPTTDRHVNCGDNVTE